MKRKLDVAITKGTKDVTTDVAITRKSSKTKSGTGTLPPLPEEELPPELVKTLKELEVPTDAWPQVPPRGLKSYRISGALNQKVEVQLAHRTFRVIAYPDNWTLPTHPSLNVPLYTIDGEVDRPNMKWDGGAVKTWDAMKERVGWPEDVS